MIIASRAVCHAANSRKRDIPRAASAQSRYSSFAHFLFAAVPTTFVTAHMMRLLV
jgi:hypothetical protein